jgi:hypothetical protein
MRAASFHHSSETPDLAQLPPIPERPSDRPETWSEYCNRRGVLALHRQLYDDLTAWLRSDPPPAFDPFDYFALAKASEQRREFFGLTYKSTRALPGTAASMRNSTRALPGTAAEPGITRNQIVADFVASDATDLIFVGEDVMAARKRVIKAEVRAFEEWLEAMI